MVGFKVSLLALIQWERMPSTNIDTTVSRLVALAANCNLHLQYIPLMLTASFTVVAYFDLLFIYLQVSISGHSPTYTKIWRWFWSGSKIPHSSKYTLYQVRMYSILPLVMVFNSTFNNISVISWQSFFVCEENQSPKRKPQTCHKSLTNFIT